MKHNANIQKLIKYGHDGAEAIHLDKNDIECHSEEHENWNDRYLEAQEMHDYNLLGEEY